MSRTCPICRLPLPGAEGHGIASHAAGMWLRIGDELIGPICGTICLENIKRRKTKEIRGVAK